MCTLLLLVRPVAHFLTGASQCKSRNPSVSYNLIALAFQVYMMFSVIDFDNNDKLYFCNICIERDTI